MSESEKDREHISGLPDALIVQILSLVPIEDAVRTSFLSRRWQYSENMLHVTVFAPLGWKVYSEDFDPRSFRRTHDFSGDFNLCFENRNITCLSQNLKLVKVVDFSKTCLRAELLGKNYEYALVEYLLKNARVLETVIITFGQKECNICWANCMSQFLPLLAGRVKLCLVRTCTTRTLAARYVHKVKYDLPGKLETFVIYMEPLEILKQWGEKLIQGIAEQPPHIRKGNVGK